MPRVFAPGEHLHLDELGLTLELVEPVPAPCETWSALGGSERSSHRISIAPAGGPRKSRVAAWASSLGLLKRPGVEPLLGVTELDSRAAWVAVEPAGRRLDHLTSEPSVPPPDVPRSSDERLARMHELVSLVELLHRRHSIGELSPARLTLGPRGTLVLTGILAGRVMSEGRSDLEEEAARRREARSLVEILAGLARAPLGPVDERQERLATRLEELSAEPELSAGRLLSELGALRPQPSAPPRPRAPEPAPSSAGTSRVSEGILARNQPHRAESAPTEAPPAPTGRFGPPRSRREQPSRPPSMSIMAGAPGIVLNRPMRERPDFVPPELIAERRREMAERLRREAPIEIEIGAGHALELRDDLALVAALTWLIPFALAGPPMGLVTIPLAIVALLGGLKACELLPRPPAVLAIWLISSGLVATALGGTGALYILAFFSACAAAIRAGMTLECLEIRAGQDEHRERHSDRRASRMADSLDRGRLFLSSGLAMGLAHLPAALALVEPSNIVGNLFQAMIFAGLGAAMGHRKSAESDSERTLNVTRHVGVGGLLAALTFLSRPELFIITVLLTGVAAMVVKAGLDEELFGEAAGLGTHDDDSTDFERVWGRASSIYADSPLRHLSTPIGADEPVGPPSEPGKDESRSGPIRVPEKAPPQG